MVVKEGEIAFDLSSLEGKLFVIKAGGDVLDGHNTIAEDIKMITKHGANVAFVYGSKSELSTEERRHGLMPEFIGGLRVSSAAFMEKVYVPVMERRGASLTSDFPDAEFFLVGAFARKVDDPRLAYVGRANDTDKSVVDYFNNGTNGRVAVVSSLAKSIIEGGGYGQNDLLNCNADDVAAVLAIGLHAHELYLATNVSGVKINDEHIPSLGYDNARIRINHGQITDGMIPKIQSAATVAENGIPTIIFDGREPHAVLYAMHGRIGTVIHNHLYIQRSI